MIFSLTPTSGNLIVKGIQPEEKKGIILQVTTTKPIEHYQIVAVAPDEGLFSVGQVVYLARYQGQNISVDGEEYIIIRHDAILAIVNKD